MKTAWLLFLLASAAVATAQGPDKEVRLGSRVPVKIDIRPEKVAEMRKVHQRFGDCVVKKYYAHAAAYLLNHPTVDEDDREGRRLERVLADGPCLVAATEIGPGTVMMILPGDTLRYSLSDALVRRDFAAAPLADLDRVARLAHPLLDPSHFQPKPGKRASQKELAKLAAERTKEQARIYLAQFGECVVRVDPAKSHALVMTPVNSPAEAAAFAALSPRLGECVIEGRTLTLNKAIIRGTVAYGYYRLARATRSASPLAQSVSQ